MKNNDQRSVTAVDLQSIEAEQRVNLIRIAAIAGFFLIHLWHVSAPQLGEQFSSLVGFDSETPVSKNMHLCVTVLCLGWLTQAFAIHIMIAQRQMLTGMVTATTLGDLGWLTAVLCLSTGPGGPMVAGYFLIIMLSGVRFNLRLVRTATIGAILFYLVLLGVSRWPQGLIDQVDIQTVPRYHQLMVIVALLFSGIIVGQIVRHAYTLSDSTDSASPEEPR